ncbi:sugar phosphate isomerase/epimerase [Microbacterium sp. STN6]|uniref:sugar phosphate isomerase/epimerase family protein n=1 Tax=Microbacterium sp. STN6 TaxID=2995588 RepID=UPI002260AFEB|nr:sugar phosphate isomerase/epimerase [Microbacterium sp. STN6]MCX7520751.1 sugar phosphate isomerase/epimerase [Microbacterium sp. STN6]
MTSNHLSVQLYTVRELLADDLPGTLRRIAEIGFTQVEPFNFTGLPGLGEALKANGLTAPTTHMHFLGEDPRPVFEAARELGIETVIDPHTPAERWQSAESVAEIAAQLGDAAGIAAEYGLRVGYHNHAHELESVIDGVPALEFFASKLDDAVVLEVDTYWVAVGGQDPVALIKRLGDRVVALHVKDGPGTAETKDQVAVGSGSLPIRDIVEAAPNALRVIELDDSRGDRFQAVADSYAYLTAEGLA